MKYQNSQNIIIDSDITMTGQHIGETLDAVLNEQSQDILELKRNVKFLYQYGGVGTHGGGSSYDSSEFSIFATLNKVQINNDNLISLNGEGYYNLQIGINRPAGLEYVVTYTYYNRNSPQDGTVMSGILLNMQNKYTYTNNIKLDINGSIRIDVFTVLPSGDSITKQISANYITSPYTFDVYLGNSEGNKFNVNDNELLIEQIVSDGLYVYMEYDVGIQSTVSYTYSQLNSSEIIQGNISNLDESPNGKIQIPIVPDGFFDGDSNSKAGYYYLTVGIDITPVGQNKIKINKVLNFNLIPSTLYLKVSPNIKDASLYDTTNIDSPYAFRLGSISFDLKIYDGISNSGNVGYEVDAYVSSISKLDTPAHFGTFYLNERESYTIRTIESYYSKWNAIRFEVKSPQGGRFEIYKYFYVSNEYADLTWDYFYNINNQNKKHYGINGTFIQTPEFTALFDNGTLVQSESINQRSIYIPNVGSDNFAYGEALINIAIQYSALNDINNPILKISPNVGLNSLTIYQNKIEIGQVTPIGGELQNGVNIYIPREDLLDSSDNDKYHLLTIYRKYHCDIQSTPQYEFLVYLDGVLEAALPNISSIASVYDSIIFYKSNYAINLFDMLYFPSNGDKKGFFTDADITKYWYTYNYFRQTNRYNNLNFLVSINNIVQKFKLNSPSKLDPTVNTCMVEVDEDTLGNLVKIEGLAPVIVFDVSDTKEFSDPESGYQDNFLKWYQLRQQKEDESGMKQVTVSFKGANETVLNPIPQNENYNFFIKKQGTSTLTNFAKNLDLIIQGNNTVCLFSPNFEEVNDFDNEEEKRRKYNTFLPEQRFTLKKDVVDSGHTNNNSIADFVNNNTTKFNIKEQGKYRNYVKNCLTGFPCIVFVRTTFHNPLTDQDISTIYYLGYYNFNLGRDSYYNLGYSTLENFDISNQHCVFNITDNVIGLSNGFKIYSIDPEYNTLKDDIIIAEVLNNSSYYDFSQYHDTVLFGADTNDSNPMFGKFVYTPNLEDTYKRSIQNFVYHISLSGGFIFETLNKNFGLQTDEYLKTIELNVIDNNTGEIINTTTSSNNQVPDYRQQYEKKLILDDHQTQNYKYIPLAYPAEQGNQTIAIETLVGDYEHDIDVPPILDYRSLVEYYVILMAFGMTDSIEKNLNIKSWNGGNTFSIAFYDMDTALGVDNGGKDVNYYAFSDYYDLLLDSDELQKAIVYRDFAFQGKGSYDIPSSYLIAIAKYAKLILGDSLTEGIFPLEYWARLRNTSLRNVDTFMNTYYKNRKASVGETLLNYDYRATYFIENSTSGTISYMNSELEQFHGSREHKVRNWLNERLHILDVYMGLISEDTTTRYIEYLDNQDSTWKILNLHGNAVSELDISNKPINDDIIIFKDIFSDKGTNYSSNIRAKIKALENSFTVITIPGVAPQYYMIKDPTKLYDVNFNITGTQLTKIGGSDRWTYIKDLTPFISGNTLQIDSNNLQEFNILSGTKQLSNVSLNLPAVRKVHINGPGNTFSLNLTKPNNPLPHIQSILLEKCSVDLTIEDSTITSLELYGVSSSTINISRCQYLTNFIIKDFEEEQPGGSKETTLTNINTLNINPLDDNFISNNTNIRVINITAINGNKNLEINNNATLEELSVSGFTNIILTNCPHLRKINIQSGSIINNLTISNCGTSASTDLYINTNPDNNPDYKIDLSGIQINGKLSFKNSTNVKSIKTASCNLSSGAFQNTGLSKISVVNDGFVYITGTSTFSNCPITTGLQYIKVDSACTDISGTFNATMSSKGKLKTSEIKKFLSNISSQNNITTIDNLFAWQDIDDYDKSKYIQTTKETCELSLYRFDKVESAVGVYHTTNITYFNKHIFEGLGSNNQNGGRVDLNGAMNVTSSLTLHCTLDSLEYVIGKTSHLNLFIGIYSLENAQSFGTSGPKLELINSSNGSVLSDSDTRQINIINFFKNSSSPTVDFTDIYNIQFTQYFNYYEFFANWPNLYLIYNCFNKVYSYGNGVQNPFESLNLNSLQNIKFIFNSFNEIESTSYLNLASLVNWNSISATSSVTFNAVGLSETRLSNLNGRLLYNSFRNIKKYLTQQEYNEIFSKFKNNSYYKKFGCIFENTLLISDSETAFVPNEINNNCLETVDTFSGAKIVKPSVISGELNDIWYNGLDEENDFIALNINDIISKIPKCKIFNGTFQNITISNALPLDFFKRRKQTSTPIYRVDQNGDILMNDDQYVQGFLIRYTYDQTNLISNLNKCFYKVKIHDNSHHYFDKNDFNNFNQIGRNYITDSENNVVSDTQYKLTQYSSTVSIPQNYELDDCDNVVVRYDYGGLGLTIVLPRNNDPAYTNIQLKDFQSNGDYNNILFVAPDIFYGCTSSCDITQCFAECNFVGALPQHLFSIFDKPIISNWINKTNILPRFIGESQVSNILKSSLPNALTKRNYVFVPDDFGKLINNYDNGFTFNTRLPIEFDTGNQNEKIIAYYIFTNRSITNNNITIKEALPVYIPPYDVSNPTYESDNIFKYDLVNLGKNYYNIMYNYNSEENNEDGWSLNKLSVSELFKGPYCRLGFGHLFKNESKGWEDYIRTNKTPILYFDAGTNGKYAQHIFPKYSTSTNLSGFISNSGARIGTTGVTTKIKKSLIIGWPSSTSINSNRYTDINIVVGNL